jgi:outer membrane protein assembly factor BamB
MFHHDPQSTGRSQHKGPRKGRIKWTFQPDGAIQSAITIGADSTIYFAVCYEGTEQTSYLYAVRPEGKLQWKLRLHVGPESQPLIVADGTIFIAGEALYSVNPDGSLKFSVNLGNELSPFLNIGLDGTLYLVVDRELCAVNQDGTMSWRTDGGEFSIFYSALSPDGNTIYLYSRVYENDQYHAVLCAVRATNGEIIWKYPLSGQKTYYSPMVDSDGNIYLGTEETQALSGKYAFYSLSLEGKQNWSYVGCIDQEPTIDPKGRVYFQEGLAQRWLVSLDYFGHLRWRKETAINMTSFICDNEGVVYHCSANNVSAYNSDGELLWQVPLVGNISRISPPAIGNDGTLYVGTFANPFPFNDSKLYAIQ